MRFIFRFAGLALIIWGLWSAWGVWRFTDTAVEAQATVVTVSEGPFGVGQSAAVEISAKKGGRLTFDIPFILAEQPVETGDEIEILHSKTPSDTAKFNNLYSIWGIPLVAILAGLILRIIVRPARQRRPKITQSSSQSQRNPEDTKIYRNVRANTPADEPTVRRR